MTPSEQEKLSRVAQLFDRVTSRPLHGSGCYCCGGPGMLRVTPVALEDMLLELILAETPNDTDGETAINLRMLVERRLASATPRTPISEWLVSNPKPCPSAPARRILLDSFVSKLEQLCDERTEN